jgi:hypothetical protein
MNYVFGMLFQYHRYHRSALVRVYADDRLVHEMTLEKDIKLKLFNWQDLPFPLADRYQVSNFSRVRILPEKLHLFEINEKYLNKKISVEVTNDQNNHTNGFMTEYSSITFHEMFLMPASLLEFDNWKRMRLARRDPFGTFADSNATYFPKVYSQFEYEIEQSTNEWKDNLFDHPRGGSFKFSLPLTRKYGLIHAGKFKRGKTLVINSDPAKILWSFQALNKSV